MTEKGPKRDGARAPGIRTMIGGNLPTNRLEEAFPRIFGAMIPWRG